MGTCGGGGGGSWLIYKRFLFHTNLVDLNVHNFSQSSKLKPSNFQDTILQCFIRLIVSFLPKTDSDQCCVAQSIVRLVGVFCNHALRSRKDPCLKFGLLRIRNTKKALENL